MTDHSRALALITLITWLFTASLGAYMFRGLASHGGLRRQRAVRDGLPPAALFAHFGLALTALAIWVGYLATGWVALAWTAVGLLMPAIGLGICTVTLWTPYPDVPSEASAGPVAGEGGAGPADGVPARPPKDPPTSRLTDEMLTRALTDEALASQLVDDVLARVPADPSQAARKSRRPLAVLIPVAHGMAAVATFALAVVTAAGMR
jgi:hypothetical protein